MTSCQLNKHLPVTHKWFTHNSRLTHRWLVTGWQYTLTIHKCLATSPASDYSACTSITQLLTYNFLCRVIQIMTCTERPNTSIQTYWGECKDSQVTHLLSRYNAYRQHWPVLDSSRNVKRFIHIVQRDVLGGRNFCTNGRKAFLFCMHIAMLLHKFTFNDVIILGWGNGKMVPCLQGHLGCHCWQEISMQVWGWLAPEVTLS